MKWQNKYNIDIEEVHTKNMEGYSLTDLSSMFNVPKTTLNRYLKKAGYRILMNRKILPYSYYITVTEKEIDYNYKRNNTGRWKRNLIFHYGHKCIICEYDKIVEAHHIKPLSDGGKTSVENGILLCPNCHAEVHAGLLNLTEALIKLGELLEHSLENNQQPSHESRYIPRVMEGSTTNSRAKAVMETRAPKSRSNRIGKDMYILNNPSLRDMI